MNVYAWRSYVLLSAFFCFCVCLLNCKKNSQLKNRVGIVAYFWVRHCVCFRICAVWSRRMARKEIESVLDCSQLCDKYYNRQLLLLHLYLYSSLSPAAAAAATTLVVGWHGFIAKTLHMKCLLFASAAALIIVIFVIIIFVRGVYINVIIVWAGVPTAEIFLH